MSSPEDIDEIQQLGETALLTLTQLWRQLPRLDSEAGKKLGNKVTDARKAIERLVRIGCERQRLDSSSLAESTKLYEPLPFGRGEQKGNRSPTRSESSVGRGSNSGSTPVRRPSFPTLTTSAAGAGGGGVDSSSRQETSEATGDERSESVGGGTPKEGGGVVSSPSSRLNHTYSPAGGGRSSSASGGSYQVQLTEEQLQTEYEKFKRELNLPPGLSFYDESGWTELLRGAGRVHLAPSRLSLLVLLAQRRELMWKLHARSLQMQYDRDALGEVETKERCEIAVLASEAREEMLAEMQGVKIDFTFSVDEARSVSALAENSSATAAAAATAAASSSSSSPVREASSSRSDSQKDSTSRVFENVKRSFEIERQREEAEKALVTLQEDKRNMVENMSKMSTQVTTLAKHNKDLTQQVAAEKQTIPPEQLKALMQEVGMLKNMAQKQEEELAAIGL